MYKRTIKEKIIVSIVVSLFIFAICGIMYCSSLSNQKIQKSINVVTVQKPMFEDVVAQTIGNVVHIRNNTGGWQGSGVLVASDLVLTARHVAEGGQDFDVMTNDGKVYKATRAISSKKYDMGFIKLDVQLPVSTKLGSIKNCRLGESVYAIGSPYGDTNFNSVTLGIISSVHRELEKFDCPKEFGWSVTFQTDTNGEPGNSGCPVFTLDGVVRGILVGGLSNGIIYCVPVDVIIDDIDNIQNMFTEDKFRFENPKDTRLDEMYEWFKEMTKVY